MYNVSDWISSLLHRTSRWRCFFKVRVSRREVVVLHSPLALMILTRLCFYFSSNSGENPLPPDDPNKELMGKTEVSLTLTNKFDVPGEANVEMDAKTLLLKWVWLNFFLKIDKKFLPLSKDFSKISNVFFSTKRLIVDVIRFQPGETLTEILDSTASSEQVNPHNRSPSTNQFHNEGSKAHLGGIEAITGTIRPRLY